MNPTVLYGLLYTLTLTLCRWLYQLSPGSQANSDYVKGTSSQFWTQQTCLHFHLKMMSSAMFQSTKMPTSSCSFLQVFVLIFQVVTSRSAELTVCKVCLIHPSLSYIFTLILYQIVCKLYNDCTITSNAAFQHDSLHFTLLPTSKFFETHLCCGKWFIHSDEI